MKKLEIKTLGANSKKGFSLLAGINRPVVPSHVTRMAKSIERMGVIRPVVVAKADFLGVKDALYIVDGQHLFHALLRLGFDIPYTEINVYDHIDLVDNISLLNSSSKSWSMRDYIQAWSSISDDYDKLQNYFNIYDIELQQLAEILMENSSNARAGGNSNITRVIKKGQFSIEDEDLGVSLLNKATDAMKVIPRLDRSSNRMFISSYVNFVTTEKDYDHSVFLKALTANKDKFRLATQDPDEFKKLFKIILK
jgi:ParB-like nuclease domain